ncbi:hypermethylated in cancer 2 protein [Paramormyrops kingsleyae]|uniref:Hypermethylated in cancer 1 protein n=1 Tax=Paramormyrops kingsleyae TaxID=1676925 RepID=A0A3B3R9S2_9TELE|nr:hypermethylated in cancer 2 protein [Paramormyrops kingsleyae]XP_023688055.1 hypermethylated in cancer 2 protein [Paramormyrops kingsleyae]
MELPNHAKQLLLQLNQQRAKGFLCDVIIVVENALFRAHKNILAASSIYFKSLVLHDNLINLDTEMVNPSVFRQILDFIYTGKLLSSDQANEQNFNALLTAASYLQLHDLAALCRKKLKRNGKALPGKPATPCVVRPVRNQRLASTPVTQNRFPGTTECEKKPSDELLKDKLSDDELFISGPLHQASINSLHCSVGKNGSNGSNGNISSASGGDQELGLDLSKKSPSAGTATEEVSPNSHSQESPESASVSTTNSASFEDSATNPQSLDSAEPMDVGGVGGCEESKPVPEPVHTRKSSRQVARKKEWPKREVGGKGEERAVPNGVIVGPAAGEHRSGSSGSGGAGSGSSFASDHSFPCKEEEEEVENGQEHSEDSGQSDGEGSHPSANYVYRQEGFEPAFGDNLYVCIPCGKGFPSSEQLNAHVETHTEEELYIKEEAAYVKEEEAEEEAEDLSAPTAPTGFGAEPRPFKCSVCSKSYKDPATLRQHEKTHWLTRPFPCNICGKMFTQRGTMTRHMRSHLGLKPFACEECGMRFTRQYRLTEHMRVHSGEKPYECQLCGGKFTQQRNLISHLRMHTSPT